MFVVNFQSLIQNVETHFVCAYVCVNLWFLLFNNKFRKFKHVYQTFVVNFYIANHKRVVIFFLLDAATILLFWPLPA